MNLNDFHALNWKRQNEVFAPGHGTEALVLCVGEEVGELCAAVLGVTGEKKRKVKTQTDVLDAVADAQTYLSLLLWQLDVTDLETNLEGVDTSSDSNTLTRAAMHVQHIVGRLSWLALYNIRLKSELRAAACHAFNRLTDVAHFAGCKDWKRNLCETFNQVSARASSSIMVTL